MMVQPQVCSLSMGKGMSSTLTTVRAPVNEQRNARRPTAFYTSALIPRQPCVVPRFSRLTGAGLFHLNHIASSKNKHRPRHATVPKLKLRGASEAIWATPCKSYPGAWRAALTPACYNGPSPLRQRISPTLSSLACSSIIPYVPAQRGRSSYLQGMTH